MNGMQQALIQACNNLSIPHEILHKDKIAVRVYINNKKYDYIHWRFPFNRVDVQRIMQDKDLQYSLLQNVIAIPKWVTYLDPNITSKYKNYTATRTFDEIVADSQLHIAFPCIAKPGMRARAENVRLCTDKYELRTALQSIFTKTTTYCYTAIVQECIPIQKELRVIFFRNKPLLVYEKETYKRIMFPRLPYKRVAREIIDTALCKEINSFVKPIFDVIDCEIVGCDIAQDIDGALWLLELNSVPSLRSFIEINGSDRVVAMHEEILKALL